MKVKIYKYIIRLFTVSLVSIMVLNIISLEVVKAAPFSGVRQTITQPNGDVIECYTSGDEFFSYLHDSDGNIIVQNTQEQYVYAKLENNIMVPSDNVVLPSGIAICDKIKITDVPESYIKMMREASPFYKQPEAELASSNDEYKLHPFLNETLNNIVIFISFSDFDFDKAYPASFYENLFNGDGNSLKNWFATASYGKTGVNSWIYPQIDGNTCIASYKDYKPRSAYEGTPYVDNNGSLQYRFINDDGSVTNWNGMAFPLFERAVNSIKSQVPLDLDLDVDNDGCIDYITFVMPGSIVYGNWILHPNQFCMAGNKTLKINGKKVYNYNVQVEEQLHDTKYVRAGVLAHEGFHIFGAYDLYSGASNIHEWDLMYSQMGQMPSTYTKYRCGQWIENIPEIKESKSYFLKESILDPNNCYMIRSPLSSDEAFILEFRKKEGIFDNYIPGTGLVIYRVNLKNNHILIDDDDPVTCFYPYRDTSVNLRLGDGTYAGIEISNISLVGDTILFSVNISNQKNALYFKDIRVAQAISKEINKDIKNITEEDLTKISELYINPVDQFDLPIDLDGIDKLVSLQKITLERCKLNDISNLKGLKNLSELRLVDNNIENIESLRDLKSLKILTLRGNLINDYSPVSGYYNNLVEKDFSLLNNDIYISIPNINTNKTIETIFINCTDFVPKKMYVTAERYTEDGKFIKRIRIDNVDLSNKNTQINIPEFINCQDGSYVVISCYERWDYKQLLARNVIKPVTFDMENTY